MSYRTTKKNQPMDQTSKSARKIYWKDEKKRKARILKYFKKNYCEFAATNILESNIILVQNLYEYHKKGLNVFQDNESHNKMMESLTEAYELSKVLQEQVDSGAYDNYDEYMCNLNKFFMILGSNLDLWYD